MLFGNNIGDSGKQTFGYKTKIVNCACGFENPPIMILDEATASIDTESENSESK
jgi:ABC-type transport system involved in cytochrome bd biosynthesis fused ATPase/permease subunit